MHFEWDDNKNAANRSKHQITFEDARKVFSDPFHLSIHDPDHSDVEDR